jgi:predicted ATPase/DNA-binding CsgD family transcriptional regulator
MGTDELFVYEPLTQREREILGLVADGLSNQQIADRLYLTLGTVKWYNKQTYQKLSVRSRTQAISRARELGLLGQATPAVKHNLPAQSTTFVGREQELIEIQRRLAEPACRLLTLLGPGGAGKTRLALEAAHQQLSHFPDGVFFVPLAPVESPEFVAQTLSDGLGLTLTSQRDPLEQIIQYLRQKRLLLVVDNFEHLLAALDVLVEVLRRSKSVKLLVTSRERLRLKEEWVFDVQGLHYPESDSDGQRSIDPAEYEAGQLFLQTVQRMRSDFVPDAGDQVAITRICQLVGGMPLGIELAASWMRLLPCVEIAREIAQGLDILSTSWRDIPERHRSIQAVLDHSWKLLAAGEQDAFYRLTVFSGSFLPQAAREVADTSLIMLLALADKSFLQRVDEEHFNIHELVKQYGNDKLRAEPERWSTTRMQHCRYYAAFLDERMSTPEPSRYLHEIEQELDDIQAAWRYAVENKHLAEIQQLAAGFLVYYRLHSWYRAGSSALELYRQALACFSPETKMPDHRTTTACLLESQGELHALATARKEAIMAYEKALESTAENDHLRRGRLYGKVADSWVAMNQHERGYSCYAMAESVLENAPKRDPAWWDEWFRIQLQRMELFYWENLTDDMAEVASQIRPFIELHGSVTQRVRYLYLLGMWAVRRDNYFNSSEAITYTGEALALSLETGNLSDIAYRRFSYGFCHLWSDHLDEAEEQLQMTRQASEQSGDLTLMARALTYLSVVYRKRKDIERVREYAAYTLRIAREAKMPQYTGMAHAQYAWLAWLAGDLAETKRQADLAIADWGGLGDNQTAVPFRWLALFPLLGVALREENIEQAVRWAKHMLAPPQQRLPDNLSDLLMCASAAWERSQPAEANERLHQAFQVAHALGYV